MKNYEIPFLTVIEFSAEDVLTSSAIGGGGGEDISTPEDEF